MTLHRNRMCAWCIAGKHKQCTRPYCGCVCHDIPAIHPEGRGRHRRGVYVPNEQAAIAAEYRRQKGDS